MLQVQYVYSFFMQKTRRYGPYINIFTTRNLVNVSKYNLIINN